MKSEGDGWLALSGAICVVTGGGSGIGRATVRELASIGAHVAILDVDDSAAKRLASEITGNDGVATAFGCDVTSEEDLIAVAKRIEVELGSVDILVNNAGVLRSGALEHLAIEDWQSLLDVNLTGYLRCAQTFGRPMLERGSGSMVHIASIAASEPQANSGAYSPGKAAVAMLSRQLAYEWGPRGVRSNTVSPGLVRTALSEAFYQEPGVLEERNAVVPMRRVGDPVDVARAVVFLASPMAAYINGQDLLVDGGLAQALMGFVPRPGFE
ncbi:MAG: SDR family NAD(P)-dependent oxidoreductase [Hyphomicrobiaceae bacterium]